jgi:hypothetical protein
LLCVTLFDNRTVYQTGSNFLRTLAFLMLIREFSAVFTGMRGVARASKDPK